MSSITKEYILELENKLLKPDIRKSPEQIKELLSDDFTEFCSSGKVYEYSVGDTFYEANVIYEIMDFDFSKLSDDCILTKYRLKKKYEIDEYATYSIRSSIWKEFGGKFKMIFHQGTVVN